MTSAEGELSLFVTNRVLCVSVKVDSDATDSRLCEETLMDVDDVALCDDTGVSVVSGAVDSFTTGIVSAGVVLSCVADAKFSVCVVADCLEDAV